jgi:hypothetical protein
MIASELMVNILKSLKTKIEFSLVSAFINLAKVLFSYAKTSKFFGIILLIF